MFKSPRYFAAVFASLGKGRGAGDMKDKGLDRPNCLRFFLPPSAFPLPPFRPYTIDMADAPRCEGKTRRRWFRLTPGLFLVALLALEGFLWFSERFDRFAFSRHKVWSALIAAAASPS